MNEDPIVRQAARAALAAQQQAPQQPPQEQSPGGVLSGADLVSLLNSGVLSPEQVFEAIFCGKGPEKFEGRSVRKPIPDPDDAGDGVSGG